MNETEQEQEIISYINGNIQTFKDYLKKCSKAEILNTLLIMDRLSPEFETNFKAHIETLKRFLE